MTLPLVGPLLDNKNSYSYSYNTTEPTYKDLLFSYSGGRGGG